MCALFRRIFVQIYYEIPKDRFTFHLQKNKRKCEQTNWATTFVYTAQKFLAKKNKLQTEFFIFFFRVQNWKKVIFWTIWYRKTCQLYFDSTRSKYCSKSTTKNIYDYFWRCISQNLRNHIASESLLYIVQQKPVLKMRFKMSISHYIFCTCVLMYQKQNKKTKRNFR